MFNALLDFIFPKKCVFCGKSLVVGAPIGVCDECADEIPYYAGEYLYENGSARGGGDARAENTRATWGEGGGDALATGGENGGDAVSDSNASSVIVANAELCVTGNVSIRNTGSVEYIERIRSERNAKSCDRIVCALNYTGFVRKAISRYKFHGYREYGLTFAAILCEKLARVNVTGTSVDFVACVPLNSLRLRERGYNQAAILAGYTAKYLGVPHERNILARDEHALRQSALRRVERLANAQSAFFINEKAAHGCISGARVLLVDDIATSMSTINACAAVLKAHGASAVVGAVLAAPP